MRLHFVVSMLLCSVQLYFETDSLHIGVFDVCGRARSVEAAVAHHHQNLKEGGDQNATTLCRFDAFVFRSVVL